jgi:CHAT domain-containing protein/tetratricopeptide (TPR) repeat protein
MANEESEQQIRELNRQVEELYHQGNVSEALELARCVCELAHHELNENHSETATSLNNLGVLLRILGDLETARPHFEQALEIRCRVLGNNHLVTAQSLGNLGELLRAMGDLSAARPYLEQSLEIRRRALGENHPDTATGFHRLGSLLKDMGELTGAQAYFEQALNIFRRVRGENHLHTATCLNSLGMLLMRAGDLAEARPHFEQALEIRRLVLGNNHLVTAQSLGRLGGLLQQMGDLSAARPYLEQALEVHRRVQGEDHLHTATCLSRLGMLLMRAGDLAGARPYLEQALEVHRRVLGDSHLTTADSLNKLGGLLGAMGDLSAKHTYFERALTIRRRVLGDAHPSTAASLNNLGTSLRAMGDLVGARPYYEQALAISRRLLGDDHPHTVTCLSNLGYLLNAIGDHSGARPYFEQVLAIRRQLLGNNHPDTANSLNNFGCLLQKVGDLAGARPYFEQALEIRRRILGDEHPDTARSLSSLGVVLKEMGKLEDARPYLEQALAIRHRVLGDRHPDTALSLNSLGGLLQDTGDLTGARPYFEEALKVCLCVLGENHPDTARSLNNLGWLEVASGRIADAFVLKRQATAIDDRMIGQTFSIGSDQQRLLFLGQFQHKQNSFLSLVYRHLSHSPEAVRSAFDLILRRKALAAEALAAQRDAVLGGRYPHLREAFEQLTQLRRRIAQKTLAGPAASETLADHVQTLHQWREEQQQRETELARQIPEVSLEQRLQKADRRVVALGLEEGVVLVEFVRFNLFDFHAVPARGERRWQPARYLAFVLPGCQPDQVQMIDLGKAGPIDRMIADFRDSVAVDPRDRPDRDIRRQPPESPATVQAPVGPTLRAAVFDKLVPALGRCKRLLLAPDGDLTRLPFEVLPDAEGRLLLEQYAISYLSCGRDVLRFGAASNGQPAEPLVVADPLFDLTADTNTSAPAVPIRSRCSRDFKRSDYHFPRLPGTREEGERVAELLGVRPWLESNALEARLKEQRSPRVLHLATHGFFLNDQERDLNEESCALEMAGAEAGGIGRLSGPLPENPLLRSGLALAGAQTWLDGKVPPPEAEDGLLTAEDVTGLDLLDTELVVLSACDTALGEVRTGEGVFGLHRAFIVAGARTLVMSLWKVPDEQTRELMIDFYRRVLSGQGVADALRQAQLAMRQKHPDPYYWGAFICQGNPGPLAFSHR